MKIDLSKVSTNDLLSELRNREGVNISTNTWSAESANIVTIVD